MIDAAAAMDLRDELEDKADKVVGAALRRFLKQATKVATSRTSALTAAAVPLPEGSGPLTLGELAAWWAALIEDQVTPELKAMFWTAYLAHRDGLPPFADPEEVAAGYMARVSDRLVRGLTPPVYEESFDRIRSSIALSQAQSWSRKDLAQRISAELSWEQRGAYWRSEKTRIDSQIDAILDPLGQPGTQAREIARLSDPRVQALRNDRNRVIRRLDDEQSYWHNRSTLIARTEATGVANHAALRALAEEGVEAKEWLSVADSRTRDSHSEANGQVVALEQPFTVGGFQLMVPGDPGAPVQETANCRCSVVGSDETPDRLEDVSLPDDEPLTLEQQAALAREQVRGLPDYEDNPLGPDGRISPEVREALDSVKSTGAQLRGRIEGQMSGSLSDVHREMVESARSMQDAVNAGNWNEADRFNAIHKAAQKRLDELQTEMRNAAYRTLKEHRGMSAKGVVEGIGGDSVTQRKFTNLQTRYPREWTELLAERGTMSLGQASRGYYSEQLNRIVISSGSSANMVHEMGHAMEKVVPGLTKMEWAYWWERSEIPGNDWSSVMETIYVGTDERGARDRWADHYTGKVYGTPTVTNRSWEIFTMGMESLFERSSYFLLPDGTIDQDYLDFILGVLGAL